MNDLGIPTYSRSIKEIVLDRNLTYKESIRELETLVDLAQAAIKILDNQGVMSREHFVACLIEIDEERVKP